MQSGRVNSLPGFQVRAAWANPHFPSPLELPTTAVHHPRNNTVDIVAYNDFENSVSTQLLIQDVKPNNIIDFNQFIDITGNLSGICGRTSFDQKTKTLFVDLATRKGGVLATDTPLFVGVTDILNPLVQLLDVDGVTPDGISYFDFALFVDDSTRESSSQTTAFVPVATSCQKLGDDSSSPASLLILTHCEKPLTQDAEILSAGGVF